MSECSECENECACRVGGVVPPRTLEQWVNSSNVKGRLYLFGVFCFIFCVRLDGVFFMVLRFLVGDRHEGSTPLIWNLLVAYEAHQGLVTGRSSYTNTDKSVVMLTLYS